VAGVLMAPAEADGCYRRFNRASAWADQQQRAAARLLCFLMGEK
jgi:hypothetical protein